MKYKNDVHLFKPKNAVTISTPEPPDYPLSNDFYNTIGSTKPLEDRPDDFPEEETLPPRLWIMISLVFAGFLSGFIGAVLLIAEKI
jgi:hypothetical protein